MKKISIYVQTKVCIGINDAWRFWTEPEHIKNWYFASDDWYVPHASNNLCVGGQFNIGMSAKDKKSGFDFEGTYTKIVPLKAIEYKIKGDERKVKIVLINKDNNVEIIETFETENTNSIEKQRSGWQAILNNFKKYVEARK